MNKIRILIITVCAIIFVLTVKLIPVISFHNGKNQLEKQNYVKAYKSLKKAYNFDRKNKDYRYYYVQSLSNLSPTLTVQKEVFEIANGKEQDSAQLSAENLISKWRTNILINIGDNYIEQAPFEKGVIRWDTDKFPLKTAITDDSKTNLPPYYKEEILKALSQWQTSVPFLKFETTENIKSANIIIKISPTPKNLCTENECRYVVGFTTPDYRGNILRKMTIVLYAKDPVGNFFSDKELYNTILHEIGHALGIMGHSYSADDLMYMNTVNSFYTPYKSSFQYLSSKDINTVKLLYKLIPTITNTEKINTKGLIYAPIVLGTSDEINERKIKEAKNYIKNAPDLSGGYVDLGIAYVQAGKYKDAVKAMEKAFNLSKTDNEKYTAAYNLALIYLENKKFDDALKFANIAKQIENTEEVKDLIANINNLKKH